MFNKKEFETFLEGIGTDCCQYFIKLEGSNVIHNWSSNIHGKITKYKDIELYGVLIYD